MRKKIRATGRRINEKERERAPKRPTPASSGRDLPRCAEPRPKLALGTRTILPPKEHAAANLKARGILPTDSEELRVALLRKLTNDAAIWTAVYESQIGTVLSGSHSHADPKVRADRGEEALNIARVLKALVLAALGGDETALQRFGATAAGYLEAKKKKVAPSPSTPIGLRADGDLSQPSEDYAIGFRKQMSEFITPLPHEEQADWEKRVAPRQLAEWFLTILGTETSGLHSRLLRAGVRLETWPPERRASHLDNLTAAFAQRGRLSKNGNYTKSDLTRFLVIDGLIALGYPEKRARKIFEASEKRQLRKGKGLRAARRKALATVQAKTK